jgi:uncharacterized protein YvpB
LVELPSCRLTRRSLLLGTAGLVAARTVGSHSVSAQPVTPSPVVQIVPPPIRDPESYKVYIPAACKAGDFFWYSCEFDAAWAVLKSFGIDSTFEELLAIVGHDKSIEPYYQETPKGFVIHGGDISQAFCGNYTNSMLARTRASAMRKAFKHYGLRVSMVRDRADIKGALKSGRLVWVKVTVDFQDWTPAKWITPGGNEFPAVLTNDHAAVVMGYDENVAVLRDTLGPTDTNWNRLHEYEVPWDRFMKCWGAQGFDGLAVGLNEG